MSEPLAVTVLDNVDSFTWNLVDEFARRGARVRVFRNDVPAARVAAEIGAGGPRLLVISPGPGTPERAGCSLELIDRTLGTVPLFGVCLGHQALVVATGGTVGRAPAPVHGKASPVTHGGRFPFEGLPDPLPAGRYHSLVATRLSPALEPVAVSGDLVMAVRHRSAPAVGVQFHPESVLTRDGGRVIDHVMEWARDAAR
jgi:anthranilate synthase component II